MDDITEYQTSSFFINNNVIALTFLPLNTVILSWVVLCCPDWSPQCCFRISSLDFWPAIVLRKLDPGGRQLAFPLVKAYHG